MPACGTGSWESPSGKTLPYTINLIAGTIADKPNFQEGMPQLEALRSWARF